MPKKRLLSGIRPTSSLHIGHYLGVLRNWVKLQDEHECFYFIADWHTLTTKYKETNDLQKNIIEVGKDIISSGINPNKSTLYVQSAVPEVAELRLLLSMITYQNWVERDPTLKDMIEVLTYQSSGTSNPKEQIYEKALDLNSLKKKIEQSRNKTIDILKYTSKEVDSGKVTNYEIILSKHKKFQEQIKEELDEFDKEINKIIFIKEQYENTERKIKEEVTYGLLGYPVLMTADILSVLGEFVPVGKDQVAHLEFTRDVARRFNHLYKTELFPEPRALLNETPSIPGIDGRKMSKSLNNDIKLEDSEAETLQKVKQMITDPNKARKNDPGNPENCQVAYKHYEIFADKAILETVRKECTTGTIGCVDCKKRLGDIINHSLSHLREKRL